jgi:hypothetical protein
MTCHFDEPQNSRTTRRTLELLVELLLEVVGELLPLPYLCPLKALYACPLKALFPAYLVVSLVVFAIG